MEWQPFCRMHACDIKSAVRNVHGTCLIHENHEHLYPQNILTIHLAQSLVTYRLLFKNAYDPHLYQEVDLQSHWNTVRKLERRFLGECNSHAHALVYFCTVLAN